MLNRFKVKATGKVGEFLFGAKWSTHGEDVVALNIDGKMGIFFCHEVEPNLPHTPEQLKSLRKSLPHPSPSR